MIRWLLVYRFNFPGVICLGACVNMIRDDWYVAAVVFFIMHVIFNSLEGKKS